MGELGIPQNYINFNSQQTKNPVVVVDIVGAPDILTNQDVSTTALYGDPNLQYGTPGLVYGGLRPYLTTNPDGSQRTFKNYLVLDKSSFTLQQRIEPEQGKASVGTLTLAFIDPDNYMTQLVSPGVVLDEILGAEVNVFLGYQQISFPQDFFRIFHGYISSIVDGPGYVTLQISDPNIKRRQQLFYCATTTLSAPVAPSDTVINVVSTNNFFKQITGPDGTNPNPSIHTYILIDQEYIEVNVTSSTQFTVTGSGRGARGSTAASHSSGGNVQAAIQIGDSTHKENAMDMALKIMLSGWDGPWITGEKLLAIGPEPDSNPGITTTSFVTLPTNVDAVNDYNLIAGDYIIMQGSSHSGNNNTLFKIVSFSSFAGQSNRIINISGTLTKEQDTPATIGFRSQFDVYPLDAGLMLKPTDVDIAQHLYIRDTFLGQTGNDLIFFITSPEDSGKNFLEQQIYFPIGAYSLTRRGLISCGYHAPPIANQNLSILDETNIIDPDKGMQITRATNNRAFYDEIDITYDYDDSGQPHSTTKILGDGFTKIGIASTLPIDAKGVYSGYSSQLLLRRAQFLLTRYNRGAVQIDVKVDWQTGNLIEAGDVVAIQDKNGVLQIANFNTGARDLSGQLFEVIDRTFDIRNGNVQLKLVGGLGATVTSRYATVSPSSVVDVGSTATAVIIKDSYGAIFPGNESKKWSSFVGLPIYVHSKDYSVAGQATLLGIDASNNYQLNVTNLGFTPAAGYVVDVPPYPNSTDPTVNSFYKTLFCFVDPTVSVATGISTTQFTVGGGDIGKFHVGCPVRIHTKDYSSDSGDLTVSTIVGTTITVSGSMGFTPTSSMIVDLIGFADFNLTVGSGQPYRLI